MMKKITTLLGLAALAIAAKAADVPLLPESAASGVAVTWQKAPSQIRFGVARDPQTGIPNTAYAYWFGVSETDTYVVKRVFDPAKLNDDAVDEARRFLLGTGTIDLTAQPTDAAVWADPKMTGAKAMIDLRIAQEQTAGTIPKALPWRVAPNPSSTTTPPTRPMFSAQDVTKTVSERAIVGSLCDCAAPVPKGTQTLCVLRKTATFPAPTTNLTACVRDK